MRRADGRCARRRPASWPSQAAREPRGGSVARVAAPPAGARARDGYRAARWRADRDAARRDEVERGRRDRAADDTRARPHTASGRAASALLGDVDRCHRRSSKRGRPSLRVASEARRGPRCSPTPATRGSKPARGRGEADAPRAVVKTPPRRPRPRHHRSNPRPKRSVPAAAPNDKPDETATATPVDRSRSRPRRTQPAARSQDADRRRSTRHGRAKLRRRGRT